MPPTSAPSPLRPARRLGTAGVGASAVALVVSASTLATDLNGLARYGAIYAAVLVIGMIIVGLVAFSTCDLALSHPRAGGIYQYARAVLAGPRGQQAGLFLALLFFGSFLLAAAAETRVTAEMLRDVMGPELPVEAYVAGIALLGLAPNFFGLRAAAGVTGGLLVVMLGVRWWLGCAGFLGWSPAAPEWEVARLFEPAATAPGGGGLLGPALALGLWTFAGLEGSCALVEEVNRPARTLPRALVLAAVVILGTSLGLTVGLGGALPRDLAIQLLDTAGQGTQALPTLLGEALFGRPGSIAMAAAAFASTTSTLIIALAAVPRMILALARDGLCFGRFSHRLAQVDPRTGSPRLATLLVGALYLAVALGSGPGLSGVYAAAYLFFFRYGVLHLLALINSRRGERRDERAPRGLTCGCALLGLLVTLAAWQIAFSGRHGGYGAKAGAVAACAAVLAAAAWQTRVRAEGGATAAPAGGRMFVALPGHVGRRRTRPPAAAPRATPQAIDAQAAWVMPGEGASL